MKPIPLDSPQQSAVDEEKTLKPGSVPVQPIQIPEVDDLEDDLDAVVSYVALLHRAVPPLNRKPTIQPSKVNTEKEQELPKPTIPQLPVHIRPIPSGAFIPGIGLAKRPGAVPIRINNLSNLPPDAILVRRPGPPPPTLLARPGPPPTLLARPGPPTQQTRPGPPPPIQTNVRPLSNGQFRPGIIFTLDEAGKPHFSPLPPRPQHLPPQPAIPETQPQSQALPEREKISSGQKPDDTSLRQPAVDQPPSSVETQTFVRPTQSQEYLNSEVPEVNDNSQASLTTLEITEPKSTSPQPSELFSPARPTSPPTIQRPEILPLHYYPIPLKPETLPPPVKPASESPKTKPVILIPTIQKTEIDPRPQSLEIRPPPQSAILQRPGSQLLQRPSPQRPEVLLPFQPTSQTSVAQPLRPFPQRPESQPPSPAAQTIESQLPQGPIQLRPESQPQRPETKLPQQLILQRPPPQRPGDLPSIQRPPLKRPQTLQRPEVLPAGMLPPPRPFPGAHPRPETPQRTQPPTLRPQLLPRPPTGPFFRPGVPPESPLRRPVVSKPQFQPSRPTVPFSQGKPSLQEPLKPQSGTDDFKPLTPSPEIPPATENQQLQSNQFIRGDDQKLIDNILGSLPDFLKGSVKIDHTNLGAENAVSVSNSYGNVIYQKRGITYIDQVQ
ncbi:hypothetical protein C7M84_025033 [Penaeus vannamei]|uniref:Uncharacterized protein n=1 Tax=Penaeus vannamei TaxID=6689 RepID=A0A423TZC6_PENVA|nr:hypothetical protein C7M84_025033 [Penaeus vannamei]